MYKIEDDEDLSPLVGQSVVQAEVDSNSVLFRLDDGTEIHVESGLVIDGQTFRFPLDRVDMLDRTLDDRIMGRRLQMVHLLSDTDISLVLDDALLISIDGDDEHYECYSISGPKIDLVV